MKPFESIAISSVLEQRSRAFVEAADAVKAISKESYGVLLRLARDEGEKAIALLPKERAK